LSFLDQFAIQFAGLKSGSYNFEFAINDSFFEKFTESEIKKGKVDVHVELQRQARMMVLLFNMKGSVMLTCDRCLDEFDIPVDSQTKLIVNFGKDNSEDSEEIITISESENEINVAQFIYEFIHLALPMKRVHPDDEKGNPTCNSEVMKKLKEHTSTTSENNEEDPRWELLKKLKFN
jgi:uncharacterized metal-binding protein YceD (DUF177 family)